VPRSTGRSLAATGSSPTRWSRGRGAAARCTRALRILRSDVEDLSENDNRYDMVGSAIAMTRMNALGSMREVLDELVADAQSLRR
jgi:hypothetical protein